MPVQDNTGENVAGAQVDLFGEGEKLTNENGIVIFKDVVKDNYDYRVKKEKFAPVRGKVVVDNTNGYESVILENAPYTITFNVMDENNISILSAPVDVFRRENGDYEHYDWGETNENGIVTFWAPSDNYGYYVDKDGYVGEWREIEVVSEDIFENIWLEVAPYNITFNVMNENFDPVDGAEVYVERGDNGEYYGYERRSTNQDGVVKFEVPSDNYRYTVYTDSFAENHGEIEIVNDNVYENVILRTGVALTIWEVEGQGTILVDGIAVNESKLPFEKVYDQGGTAQLSADPDEGWYFGYWEGIPQDDNEVTLTMDEDKNITKAVFEEETTEYVTLTIENIVGQGSVFIGENEVSQGYSENFEQGVEVSLSAVPDNGYYFENWFGDYVSFDNEIVLSIDENLSLSAHFSQIKDFVLSINVEGQGYTSPHEGKHTYENGDYVNLTAFSEEGWTFENWLGDLPENYDGENTVEIVMDDNKTLTAVFSEEGVVETVELSAGWNLFSLPVVPDNGEVRAVFDNLGYSPDVVGWTNQYKPKDDGDRLEVGEGYWVYLKEEENISVRGITIDNFILQLNEGWNISGLPRDISPMTVSNVFDNLGYSPDVVGWTNQYKPKDDGDNLESGEGYWMYLRNADNIELSI